MPTHSAFYVGHVLENCSYGSRSPTTLPKLCCMAEGTSERTPATSFKHHPVRIAKRLHPVLVWVHKIEGRHGYDTQVRNLGARVGGVQFFIVQPGQAIYILQCGFPVVVTVERIAQFQECGFTFPHHDDVDVWTNGQCFKGYG